MILGCLSFLRSNISRRILRDSCLFSKKFLIFLMATVSPVSRFFAKKTIEETPSPIFPIASYLELFILTFAFSLYWISFNLSFRPCFRYLGFITSRRPVASPAFMNLIIRMNSLNFRRISIRNLYFEVLGNFE